MAGFSEIIVEKKRPGMLPKTFTVAGEKFYAKMRQNFHDVGSPRRPQICLDVLASRRTNPNRPEHYTAFTLRYEPKRDRWTARRIKPSRQPLLERTSL